MSLSTAVGAAATSATSAVSFHPHSHKHGVHSDSATESSPEAAGQTPATTQGLFGSLLTTLTQAVGAVNPLAGTALAALTPSATAGNATAAASDNPTANALGRNVDAKV